MNRLFKCTRIAAAAFGLILPIANAQAATVNLELSGLIVAEAPGHQDIVPLGSEFSISLTYDSETLPTGSRPGEDFYEVSSGFIILNGFKLELLNPFLAIRSIGATSQEGFIEVMSGFAPSERLPDGTDSLGRPLPRAIVQFNMDLFPDRENPFDPLTELPVTEFPSASQISNIVSRVEFFTLNGAAPRPDILGDITSTSIRSGNVSNVPISSSWIFYILIIISLSYRKIITSKGRCDQNIQSI